MNGRIKLAEAMGWHRDWCGGTSELYSLVPPGHKHTEPPSTAISCYFNSWFDSRVHPVPDPFTDANDDYAVLEWARQQGTEFLRKFRTAYEQVQRSYGTVAWWQHKIGDYARAALKVLE